MNLKEIKELIELVNDKGFAEFEIERQGFRLRISRFRDSNSQIIQPASPPIIISSPVPATSGALPAVTPGGFTEPDEYPAAASKPPARVGEKNEVTTEPELHIIKSPIVGTFYSAPSPDSEAFVRMGDHIRHDTVVCIIEAMKLMNEIQAEVNGEVARIFVENGQPVEYGQALFGIKTA
ncbi:MAG TPA: acetyl-CoA carboxylase biotin carboxyl carrier protein [Blastocatellia bacterium]|nr:acetyl-CoA carboxylase biotin carboxyl carrier protein [Blastocatellia bacterium]